MRKLAIALLFAAGPLLCFASDDSSSGFIIGNNAHRLPYGIPAHVACLPFDGPIAKDIPATNRFCTGILNFGFEVLDRQHMQNIAQELKLQRTGLISSSTISEMGREIGVDAFFVGTVFSDSEVSTQLINVIDGKVVWSANASGIENALQILRSDLSRYSQSPSLESNPIADLKRGDRIRIVMRDGTNRTGTFDLKKENRFYFEPDKGDFSTLLIYDNDVKSVDLVRK